MNSRPRKIHHSKRLVAVQTLGGGKHFPACRAIYEVMYSDGTVRIEYGNYVRTMRNFLPVDGSPLEKSIRPDLDAVIRASEVLTQTLETACLLADSEDSEDFKDSILEDLGD